MGGTNKNNFGFYKNIGVTNLLNLQEIGGFTACNDMQMVWPHIKSSKNILELGAGTGRIVDFLIKNEYAGHITAIEQSEEFLTHLNKQYGDKAEIISGDFQSYDFNKKFDVVLWMWSGILDFSPEEQSASFDKINSITEDNGVLVIDTPKLGIKTFASHEDAQHIHLESEYGDLNCYLPSVEDIEQMCSNNGFKVQKALDYNTSTDKARTLYLISKK